MEAQVSAPFVVNGKTMRSGLPLLVAMIAVWLAGTALAFYLRRTDLFVGFDGSYMRSLAQRQFEWQLPLLSASIDWFQGLGDVFFAINFRLLPALIAGSYFGSTDLAKVFTYEIVLCELALATILFGLSLGASRTVAIAAALVTSLALMPFRSPSLVYSLLGLTPQIGSLIACSLTIAACFLRFGRGGWLSDLPFGVLVLVLLAWSVLVSVPAMLLSAPFLVLCAVSGVIASGSRSERLLKIGLLAASLLLMVGPATYLAGEVLDTAAVVYGAELPNDRASLFLASILFHWNSVGKVGPLLVILALGGAAFAAFDRTRRTLRTFAIALVVFIGVGLTFVSAIIAFDFWRGPAPLYFEFFFVPLYAVYAAMLCEGLLVRLRQRLGRTGPTGLSVDLGLIGAGAAAALVLAAGTSRADYGFPYPPQSTKITNVLAGQLQLKPGSVFRGRAANMVGRSIPRDVSWFDLHGIDGTLTLSNGNELRLVGLNYFGIPTLFEYTPTISPFFYAVTTRLLALPEDRQMRNVVVLRNLDPRILAMLGVRFVITDREYDGSAAPRASISANDRTLSLYEIANPNLGGYSPTRVSRLGTATEIIERLGDPDFDPSHEIIADLPIDKDGLVAARSAQLTFLGESLRLQAESDGRSVLLVPLEFSRCLGLTASVHPEPPLLFRANLVETGVLFSQRLDTTLSIRTGPFLHPACRLRDYFDARELRLKDVPRSIAQPHSSDG